MTNSRIDEKSNKTCVLLRSWSAALKIAFCVLLGPSGTAASFAGAGEDPLSFEGKVDSRVAMLPSGT